MATDLLARFAVEAGKTTGKKILTFLTGASATVLGVFAINRIITKKDRQEGKALETQPEDGEKALETQPEDEKKSLEKQAELKQKVTKQRLRLKERERIKAAGIDELDHIIHRYDLAKNFCAFTAEYREYYSGVLSKHLKSQGIEFIMYSNAYKETSFVVKDSCFKTLMAIARVIPLVQSSNLEYNDRKNTLEKRIITEDGFLMHQDLFSNTYLGPVPSIDDYLKPEDVATLTEDERTILHTVLDKWLSGEVLTFVDISATQYSQWKERLTAIDKVLKRIE